MSKDLYIGCQEHRAVSDEVGHADISLVKVREWVATRTEKLEILRQATDAFELDPNDIWDGKLKNAMWFFRTHPECNLEIFDEYGTYYDLSVDPTTCYAILQMGPMLRIVCDRDQADGHENHEYNGTDDRGMSFDIKWRAWKEKRDE